MSRLIFPALLTLACCFSLSAQVHINEFSASNLESFYDSFGKTEDWIELHNSGTEAVDISGWHLSDKESKPVKWEIPAGTILDAGSFQVFYCSGRDQFINDEYHTNFKLTQTKGSDLVLLSDASGDVVEIIPLGLTFVEHSHCRIIDGGDEWAISTEPTLGSSNNESSQVTGYTAAPAIDLEAGFYEVPQTVTLTNNQPSSTLRFTTDGTNPTSDSPFYVEPINITSTTVIKARSFSNNPAILPGKIEFRTYFIDEEYTLAVFSVAADDVIDLANGEGALIPIGSLEYFNTDNELEATSFGSLNRHGQDSWILDHRSLDWISRDEMGYSKAVDAPLFSYSERDEYQKFMFRNSGDDNYPAIEGPDHEGSTHIRDEYVQTLAQEGDMKLDTRAVERVVLYLNGEYWGVYGMRERPVDHDYTDEYYDQGKYDVQYLSTWGTTEVEYGGLKALTEWNNLRDFILENDMSDPANYEQAEDSLNMTSLIDYMIVNLNVVAADWLNYNTGWWRGRNPEGDHKKWGYILWDMDATFDYYINYTNVPDVSANAVPCSMDDISVFMDEFFGGIGGGGDDVNEMLDSASVASCNTVMSPSFPYPAGDSILGQVMFADAFCCNSEWDDVCQGIYDQFTADAGGEINLDAIPGNVGAHEKLFLKLIEESPEFKQLYFSRYADMANTVFSCENMNTTLDRMLAVIEPEMPAQIARWGGSITEWLENVEELREFIDDRCINLQQNLLCYEELSGPHQVTLMTQPEGIGEIDFNTLDIEAFPWSGNYYGGTENLIKAKVFDEFEDTYSFSHWESRGGNVVFPDSTARRASITLEQTDTLVAVFSLISSTSDFATRFSVEIFPNPTSTDLTVNYTIRESLNGRGISGETSQVQASLYSSIGNQVMTFPNARGEQTPGNHQLNLSLDRTRIPTGLYFLVLEIGSEQQSFKVNVVE